MITLRDITLRRGTKVVLQGASVVLQPGEKVGLIGRNGAGKSSLFALLTHRLQADAGDVEIPPRWRVGEVAQDMPETDDGATDFVLQGDLPLVAAQAELAAAEPAATATPWPTPTWRWTKPAPSTPARARRRCCWAWASRPSSSMRR
jgi:ATPase subunit of ABC transporter with duplicated ATPase domains